MASKLCLVVFAFAFSASRVLGGGTPQSATSELKKLSLDELLDIDITSVSKKEERLFRAASAVQVITREDIRRSGANSIPEALRLATNLQVAQVDSRQWAVTSRGFNGTTANKLLVLIDGRSVYTPLFSGVFWDVQDTLLEDIERIEVISGPGGTLWGANAVNGVVNIITGSSRETQGVLWSGSSGTPGRALGGIRYGGRLGGGVTYRVYGKHFDRNGSRQPDGSDAGDRWKMTQGGVRVDSEARGGNAFTLQGDAYGGAIQQLSSGDVVVDGANLIGRWTKTLSDTANFELQFYYDNTHRVIPDTFSESLHTYDLDLQHRFAAGKRNDVLWGLNYRLNRDRIGNSAVLLFLPASLNTTLFSAFVQDEVTLPDGRLKLIFGTKLERNDFSGFEYQPSMRLAFAVAPARSVWAAVSRAVRTPSRIDRDFFVPSLNLEGGPGFDSEKLIAYELGFRALTSESLALSLAGFFHRYDDLRSLELTVPRVLSNGLAGEGFGAEFAGTGQVTPSWRLTAGYTYLQIHLHKKPGSTDVASETQEGDSPRHQFLLRSSVDVRERVQWDTTARYVDRLPNQSIPSYWAVDMRVAYLPRKDLELALIGRNLLDDEHPEFGVPAQQREIQRSIAGKITWTF